MSKQYTIEEVQANLRAAQERIKPAVLVETPVTGLKITAYIQENKLEPTVESFYKAINHLAFSIPWIVEPAKLRADKLNKANIAVLPNARKDDEELLARKSAVEAAEKKRVEDEKTFERIDGAINNLYLRRLSETASQKERLRGYVKQEKARNAIPETIFEQVKKEIERLYKEEARIAERM
jgi:hypothetical protein